MGFWQGKHLYSIVSPSCFLIYGLQRHLSSMTGNNAHLKLKKKKPKKQTIQEAETDSAFTLASLALLEPFPSVFFCLEEELLLLPLLLSLPGLLLDFRDEDWLTVLFLELCSCLESFCRAGAAGEGSKSFSLTALGFEDLEKKSKFRVCFSTLINKTSKKQHTKFDF